MITFKAHRRRYPLPAAVGLVAYQPQEGNNMAYPITVPRRFADHPTFITDTYDEAELIAGETQWLAISPIVMDFIDEDGAGRVVLLAIATQEDQTDDELDVIILRFSPEKLAEVATQAMYLLDAMGYGGDVPSPDPSHGQPPTDPYPRGMNDE